jgi:hypothetical protein
MNLMEDFQNPRVQASLVLIKPQGSGSLVLTWYLLLDECSLLIMSV